MQCQNKKSEVMKRNRNMKITSVKNINNSKAIAPILLNVIGVPYLLAEFRKKEYLLFVVDTGATESYIDSRVYDFIKDKLQIVESKSFARCVDGSEISSEFSAIMKFKVNGNNCKARLSVMKQTPLAFDMIEKEEGIRIHGILGIDFLKSNNLILDFCNNIIVRYNANKVA